jgi:hypothetical protein
LPIKGGHHFGRDDGIYANAQGKQFRSPFSREA